MRQNRETTILFPTDLSNHLSCPHLTQLNVAAARGELNVPFRNDSRVEALQLRGIAHEQAYLDHLRANGRTILELPVDATPEAVREAMRSGADVIVQAPLSSGRWQGRADVLLRVARPSVLGDWSYEAADTKLSSETKAGTILQLAVYTEIVGEMQEALPESMHVVTPRTGFVPETYRTLDHVAYYRYVRSRLEACVDDGDHSAPTYPEPVDHCNVCRWRTVCIEQRRADDHLSLVANVTKIQRGEFERNDVETLARLGSLPVPFGWKPSRGSVEVYEKAREQARVQLEARRSGKPVYELLPVEPERGLCRLPEPSPGDVFFDLEGDPFVDPGGREYLWGWVTRDAGEDVYHHVWAMTAEEERAAFEGFVDLLVERCRTYPGLHVYHYAPYEPGALKRLMGRYATREDAIDRFLREGRLVDLYGVVRQSLRAGVERYSIKDLEQFFGYVREVSLPDASRALRKIEFALETNAADDPSAFSEDERERVRIYNADDCYATRRLRNWLEDLREEGIASGQEIARPILGGGDASEAITEWQLRIAPVQESLWDGVPADASSRTPAEDARWILGHLLEFHRRELKAPYWEFFRLAELGPEELLEERNAIAGLEFVQRVGGTVKAPIDRYTFPFQETSIGEADTLSLSAEKVLGDVHAIDPVAGWVEVKKRMAAKDVHPGAVFSKNIVQNKEAPNSLLRIAEWVVEHGIDADGPYRAGRDLLLRFPPRLSADGPIRRTGETSLDAARRLVSIVDRTTLCIQGPPGSGKTYTAARMAVDVISRGGKVGVCALSHKVIRNLLDALVRAGDEAGKEFGIIQKPRSISENQNTKILEINDYDLILANLTDGLAHVVGGTAWMWAREGFAGSVDVLFLDEASQFALADAIAISAAAPSLVLVGDPQQLESPIQGSHPDGTDASALHHFLGDEMTMPPDRGLFIEETRRLCPAICSFTSEQFYENRLFPFAGLDRQRLVGSPFAGSGLWFVPVPHEGNRNTSPEEVARVAGIFQSLIAPGVAWTDAVGASHPMTPEDVLIVAPYNAHVTAIGAAVPEARAGTVDKFQGQEAAVVIYSMATSSPDEAPRGMEFLYSLNRLNVATSRARCVCILVASPKLFEVDCRSPRQMRLANAFCRYLEMAPTLS